MAEQVIWLLQAFGDAAVEPLAEAIAGAKAADRERRAAADPWAAVSMGREADGLVAAFGELKVSDVAKYVPLLRHRDGEVRYETLQVLLKRASEAIPHLAQVVSLLDDPDAQVRMRAAGVVQTMGAEAVAPLREMRRAPGRHRRRAMIALLHAGGWYALESADQNLLRRLILGKIAREMPEPYAEPNGDFFGDWIAVSTADQDALLDALGLVDSMPVTMRLGWAVCGTDGCAYLTPELDGWTLIFGYRIPDDDMPDSLGTFLAELSRRFGAAQWYFHDYGAGGWAMAERGVLIRHCFYGDAPDDVDEFGPPHPAEVDEALDGHALYPPAIAARASVDPTALGTHTRVRGHGRIGVVDRRVTPRGVYPI
ncbi:hypothetical protein [Nocardia sp. NPDC052566]|uniref:hypothetical protein n=1 Tax=Nocardia sp. NPDC052566 TaxID=3364330 RepID=UPI0037CAE9E3